MVTGLLCLSLGLATAALTFAAAALYRRRRADRRLRARKVEVDRNFADVRRQVEESHLALARQWREEMALLRSRVIGLEEEKADREQAAKERAARLARQEHLNPPGLARTLHGD